MWAVRCVDSRICGGSGPGVLDPSLAVVFKGFSARVAAVVDCDVAMARGNSGCDG
jgi:hypothetical protein